MLKKTAFLCFFAIFDFLTLAQTNLPLILQSEELKRLFGTFLLSNETRILAKESSFEANYLKITSIKFLDVDYILPEILPF